MDSEASQHLSCAACGAALSEVDRAFCDAGCRARWREARRARYARPPGPLSTELLRALADELGGSA